MARRLTEFAELQQPGRATDEVLIADALIARGDFEGAVALLRDAAARHGLKSMVFAPERGLAPGVDDVGAATTTGRSRPPATQRAPPSAPEILPPSAPPDRA